LVLVLAMVTSVAGCSPEFGRLRVAGVLGDVRFEWVQCRGDGMAELSVYETTVLKARQGAATPVWAVHAPDRLGTVQGVSYASVPARWQQDGPAPRLSADVEYTAVAKSAPALSEGSLQVWSEEITFRPAQVVEGSVLLNRAGRAASESRVIADARPASDFGCGTAS
jgi:hypothetical protein